MFVVPADCQTAWVEARRTARTAAGAKGRGNSVAARLPLLLRPLRRQAAGWPAAGAGGPIAGAALVPETETETRGKEGERATENCAAGWVQPGVSNNANHGSAPPNTCLCIEKTSVYVTVFNHP